jgi:hypothetical protein
MFAFEENAFFVANFGGSAARFHRCTVWMDDLSWDYFHLSLSPRNQPCYSDKRGHDTALVVRNM